MNLSQVFMGLAIHRFHTRRTIHPQSVAEHSARMAATLCYLFDAPSGNLLKATILHDVSEIITGDVPSPVKWANPALKDELNRVTTEYEVKEGLRVPLTNDEAKALKFVDLYEGCQFCIDEIRMGNSNMKGSLMRYCDALSRVGLVPGAESKSAHLFNQVNQFVSEMTK